MRIIGKLKDDIITGNSVLFLGAGASRCCGINDAMSLTKHIYKAAGSPIEFAPFAENLAKLVAKLDRDPMYTRKWVNKVLIEYFMEPKRYSNLSHHKRIFDTPWKAIFTTNYDIALELAEFSNTDSVFRLLPITDPNDAQLVTSTDKNKVKYFKIHGCCKDIEQHPTNAMPLVITQKDFQDSISRNKFFMEELRRLAYDSSIIFIGFQAQLAENNFITGSIQEACRNISQAFQQNFTPFAILKDVDKETKEDLEDIDINVIDGSFEEFLDEVAKISSPKLQNTKKEIFITSSKKTISLELAEYIQLHSQFLAIHDEYYAEKMQEIKTCDDKVISDLWKTNPSDSFLASQRYIRRSCYHEAISGIDKAISRVVTSGSPHILVLEGGRASGKSVVAKQLAYYAYHNKRQPVLVLNPDANYIIEVNEHYTNVTGWDGRLIDKFLSTFYREIEDGANVVPVIIADHLAHKQIAIDYLVKYLENHGKPIVVIITLSTDEWLDKDKDRLLQLYKHTHVKVPHKLNDSEIEALFDKVATDHKAVISNKSELIDRAKGEDGARDLLFILYMWFDYKFRRLDDIIIEEADKLQSDTNLKELFVSIGVFHQFNIKPRASLCAEAVGIDIPTYNTMRVSPLFKYFINFTVQEMGSPEYAATRHAEFSRRIVEKFVPERDIQVQIMRNVLAVAKKSDLQFCRNFLNYIYRYAASFTVDQVSFLKDATEKNLGSDPVLNHQYAAYLIRENTKHDEARYYLELALKSDTTNSSILHSLGNLCFSLYKNELDTSNFVRANELYEDAKLFFERSRSLRSAQDEHSYYTNIDMMRFRLEHGEDDEEEKVVLKAESHALTYEALKVIPHERQVLIKKFIGESTPFKSLNDKQKEIIKSDVISGKASPLLLEYYCDSILNSPSPSGWKHLKKIVQMYEKNSSPEMFAVLGYISKRSFVMPASQRFEKMRQYYDKIVRSYDDKTSFLALAEYIKLLSIDAMILEKFDFLRTVTSDIITIFRDSQPRFLKDEYILDKKYYEFDPSDEAVCIKSFIEHGRDFYNSKFAKRFLRLVDLNRVESDRYLIIELDPMTRFFIKGLRKEVAKRAGKYELSFTIKHTYEGFRATDFRS
jgi:hypothetical protein